MGSLVPKSQGESSGARREPAHRDNAAMNGAQSVICDVWATCPLSVTAVLPPVGIPEPRLTCGSRVGEKDESATPFSIPIYFALPLGWLRFWPSLIAFALALIGAGSKKIGPIVF